jgi:ubiquinone/menaquinone biosynthesis C-methylase UbiE
VARIDYDRAAVTYDLGRDSPLETFAEWRTRLAEELPAEPTGPILDIGAGTGIWAAALAAWFSVPVIGVEPAAAMLGAAHDKALPPGVALVRGDAHDLPFPSASCGGAWLSTVIHHFRALSSCAAELGRVLAPAAPVLIRSAFPGRHDEIPLFRFFPAAARTASTFPTIEETEDAFGAVGYRLARVERVRERRPGSMADWVERVTAMRHADSTLAGISDEEFAAGMASLRQAAAAGEAVPPTGMDLLVLRRDSTVR